MKKMKYGNGGGQDADAEIKARPHSEDLGHIETTKDNTEALVSRAVAAGEKDKA
jgi:hypothetical protein